MAAQQSERIEAMIVIAGAHRLIGKAREYHEESAQTDLPSDWYLNVAGNWHPGGEGQVQKLWRQGLSAILRPDFKMSDSLLAVIQTRTLIIQGDRDEIFPIDVPLDLHREIRHAQLWIIPNTGHASVFYQGVAPPDVDFGGNGQAAKIFPETVKAFFAGRASSRLE
jgi:pimeloyl-ACP methyl ester carboxylesterase